MIKPIVAVRDVLGRSLKADLSAEFVPLGVSLCIQTNVPGRLEASRATFGRYSLEAPDPNPPRFTLRLLADPVFSEAPPWPVTIFRGQGDLFYVCVGRQNTAVADLSRRQAIGFIAPAMVQDALFLQRTFLECLFFTMATHGSGATHTYVHASAVAKGSKGLIFSGPREAGKSTLAYACARHGFRILTDDVVYLRRNKDRLTAWGRPWRMRFLSDSPHLFPELNLPCRKDDVIEIEVDEFLPGRTQACCEPSALFFLDRSADRVECTTMQSEEAVELLERDLIYDLPEAMEMHRHAWLQLARRGSYILRYGEDLDSAVSILERFV